MTEFQLFRLKQKSSLHNEPNAKYEKTLRTSTAKCTDFPSTFLHSFNRSPPGVKCNLIKIQSAFNFRHALVMTLPS